jgi:hypothetical protein
MPNLTYQERPPRGAMLPCLWAGRAQRISRGGRCWLECGWLRRLRAVAGHSTTGLHAQSDLTFWRTGLAEAWSPLWGWPGCGWLGRPCAVAGHSAFGDDRREATGRRTTEGRRRGDGPQPNALSTAGRLFLDRRVGLWALASWRPRQRIEKVDTQSPQFDPSAGGAPRGRLLILSLPQGPQV